MINFIVINVIKKQGKWLIGELSNEEINIDCFFIINLFNIC